MVGAHKTVPLLHRGQSALQIDMSTILFLHCNAQADYLASMSTRMRLVSPILPILP